jgi:acetyl-CoA carboxylase biotin carboxylase subunit
VRHDIGVEQGSTVPIDYDPMLGKLVVFGEDRPQAISRLSRALAEYEIAGVETTLPLFRRLTADPDFQSGAFDVQWLETRLAGGLLEPEAATEEDLLLAAVALSETPADTPEAPPLTSLWRRTARLETLRSR